MRTTKRKTGVGTLLLLLVAMAALAVGCADGVKQAPDSDAQPAASSDAIPPALAGSTEEQASSPAPEAGSGEPSPQPPATKAAEATAAPQDSRSGAEAAAATDSSPDVETAAPAEVGDPPVELFLKVTSPEDESVLVTASLEVTGATNPDSVVSVGGEYVEVEADGSFTAKVALEDGPNVLGVIASNFDGQQVEEIISVIYLPRLAE